MPSKITKFTDLKAWQKGHRLVLKIYAVTKDFPSEEKFSLTSQMRRATALVTSNIAEGFGRQSEKDRLHLYAMARGSLLELKNQTLIARDIELLNLKDFTVLSEQSIIVHKLLSGLIRSIKT